MALSKIDKKDIIELVLFAVSFLHTATVLLFLVYLIIRGIRSMEDAISGLMLIAFRTIINPTIAVDISSVQMVKWAAIFGLSFLLIYHTRHAKRNRLVDNALALLFALGCYICMISLVNSTYPIVSIFKCFSWCFVFYAIVVGVEATKANVNWIDVLYRYFTVLFVGSFICLPFPFSYFSRANWFMGLTNQSNMFGIMAALYVAILMYKMLVDGNTLARTCLLVMMTIMIVMCGSRTGIIAASICVAYVLYLEIFKKKHYYWLILIVIAVLLIVLLGFGDDLVGMFESIILKNQFNETNEDVTLDNITRSRQGQYEQFLLRYNNDPAFGSGFMVPFVSGLTDWGFSFDLLVENGNIFYSILGDLGIIGLLFFIGCYGYIFCAGLKQKWSIVLFAAPFLICLGEMVFFSTNNNAILLYVMLAFYLTNQPQTGELKEV